jgi:hypothetical protein
VDRRQLRLQVRADISKHRLIGPVPVISFTFPMHSATSADPQSTALPPAASAPFLQ